MLKIFILSLLLLTNIVLAGDYCINNETVIHNQTINGNLVTVDETCNYGCDLATNSCNPSPLYQTLIIGGIFFIVLLLGSFIIRRR